MTSVPIPKQRKKWKQDLSQMKQMPGAAAIPTVTPKPNNNEDKNNTSTNSPQVKKTYQSPEKTRQKEYQFLEEKRDLYISEVERIKREFKRI